MEYMFMPLKRYAEFSGRSRRMEYWMFVLFELLLVVAFIALMGIVGGAALMGGGGPGAIMAMGGGMMIVFLLFCLIWLALLIPGLAVTVRRLHDTNRTGWWLGAYILAYIVMSVGRSMAAPGGGGAGSILTLVGGLATLGLGLTLLVFMFLEGTKGPNQYGPDPKGGVDAQVFA